jgi:hypothetical protein
MSDSLDRLAAHAETTADQLHEAIKSLRELHDRTLSLIEELGGDNEFNWSLQADLANAQTILYSTAHKARTVARHAKAGKDMPVAS